MCNSLAFLVPLVKAAEKDKVKAHHYEQLDTEKQTSVETLDSEVPPIQKPQPKTDANLKDLPILAHVFAAIFVAAVMGLMLSIIFWPLVSAGIALPIAQKVCSLLHLISRRLLFTTERMDPRMRRLPRRSNPPRQIPQRTKNPTKPGLVLLLAKRHPDEVLRIWDNEWCFRR
jgi:hypothetical protein